MIVELRADGTVVIANRDDAIIPANAKRNDVKKILETARNHYDEIAAKWEQMQGED